MSSIAWDTVRNAIQAWITTGSGLAGDHVVWSGQRDASGNPMPRPRGQYIELKLSLLRWNGFSDWRDYDYDQPNNTLTLHTRGPREAVLTATCYQGMPTGGTGYPSSTAPMAVLNDAMTSTGRDDVYNALVAAGVGVGDIGILDIQGGTFDSARFEARAIVTAKLNLASEIDQVFTQGQGWIETVNGAGSGDLTPVSIAVTLPTL
jgi:hypothetical protein